MKSCFRQALGGVGGLLCLGVMVGCGASRQAAPMQFHYDVAPSKGLPRGVSALYVAPATIGPNTDAQWSDLTANILRDLVQDSASRLNSGVTLTDRRDTQGVFDEADLRASGMSTQEGGSPGQLMASDGRILSNINVKVTEEETKDQTLDITNIGGWGGHGGGGGNVSGQTREVSGVRRTVIVQADFKLLDNNNRQWHAGGGTFGPYVDQTKKPSPLFGSSRGKGDLSAVDQTIYAIVEDAARGFVSEIVPCRIDVSTQVTSSNNKACAEGVKLLRGGPGMYPSAVNQFEAALVENPNDHQAAYGAGVACEAMGDYNRALDFYRRACVASSNREYIEARTRVERFGSRVIK